ncbi:hypothetical protein SAMN04487911_1358 [Arenibacter nanhaiticus]|uniref:O-antigen ligase like membrane protein n=1 Tax=Arenibacter nanhaiticus TaxID=558155 RepID=A0A1M6LYA9_9FLAO|nr:hypothetical protein [Arenibacter nanhaiticus]SHJ76191.1 hypothetical protein SAMN04487911_1358 [Arenibacter nanhaiticus]
MAKVGSNKLTPLMLPGLKKTTSKKHLFKDVLFFISAIAIPSSFFNFIDRSFFVDIRLFYLLIGVLYLVLNFKYIQKFKRIKGAKLLLLLCFFLLFKILHSLLFQNIIWTEVVTIFRTNFFYPIITLGFLLYASKMDNKRLYRFFYWLFTVTLIQGILYIIANITGVNFYANSNKEFQQFQGVTIIQNLNAIPDYNIFLFAFAILTLFTVSNFKKHWMWFVPLLLTILTIVRNQIIVYFLVIIIIYSLGVISNIKIKGGKIFKALILLSLFSIIGFLVFPAHIGRIVNKFGFDQNESISASNYTEEGTFKVRLDLISKAYNSIEQNDNLILGNGYIREARKGEYDFVVGDDTLLAPVLWAEGLLGIIIRLLPVLIFLFYGLKNLHNKNKFISLISLMILGITIPEIFNGVQTKIFTYYHQYLFIFFLLMLIIYNDKMYQRKKSLIK